jgi:hypothetical protein
MFVVTEKGMIDTDKEDARVKEHLAALRESQNNCIARQHEEQTKYTYFLLGAAAAAIGLSVNATLHSSLGWNHSILGVAVIAWLCSFFAGCWRVNIVDKSHDNTLEQIHYLQSGGTTTPRWPMILSEGVQLRDNARWWRWCQFWLLAAGAIAFLVWHVVSMAQVVHDTAEVRAATATVAPMETQPAPAVKADD